MATDKKKPVDKKSSKAVEKKVEKTEKTEKTAKGSKNAVAESKTKVKNKAKVKAPVKVSISTEEIIKEVAAGSETLTQKQVKECMDGIQRAVFEAISQGKKVQLTKFLTIRPVYRKERNANNVLTGEPILIPESVGIQLKAGSGLSEAKRDLNPKDFRPV
jgi:nucleoid DNA-binding protein